MFWLKTSHLQAAEQIKLH